MKQQKKETWLEALLAGFAMLANIAVITLLLAIFVEMQK